jgi:hypothetical protein
MPALTRRAFLSPRNRADRLADRPTPRTTDRALKMTNEVSVMDIVAIGGLLVGGAAVFFGIAGDVKTQGVQIAENARSISRVEHHMAEENNKILTMLKEQSVQVREIRMESEAGRLRIEEKLDKIIDRELSGERE